MNEVKLSGKLVNPKYMVTNSGTEYFTGALMTSRKDKKTNQWINDFFNIKAFKNTAIDLNQVDEKSKIEVVGKLSKDSWTDKKTGEKKEGVHIMVFSFTLGEQTAFPVDKNAVEDVKAYDLSKQVEDSDPIPF